MRNLKCLSDVVDWELCIGCGACVYACDKDAVSLWEILDRGILPRFNRAICDSCGDCLDFCPGAGLRFAPESPATRPDAPGADEIGRPLEVWEGHAANPEIRRAGSSGGALTALALYSLECGEASQVVHSAMDESRPWLNQTVRSHSREELAGRTGSRYAPSSPCEGLGEVERSQGGSLFIGKPCDAAAAQALRRKRPELDENLSAVLAFFCAGTPSTQATLDLLDELGVKKENLASLRYRGNGWPGRFAPIEKDGSCPGSLTYGESWAKLNRHRGLRCHLCPDGLGRLSDITCGDAWHRYDGGEDGYQESVNGDAGRSLILVNTERGRALFHRALEAGCIKAAQVTTAEVIAAQGLVSRRRQLFGRLLALTLLLRPVPRYVGFNLFAGWSLLSLKERLRTVVGTLRRGLQRGWYRRRANPWDEATKRSGLD